MPFSKITVSDICDRAITSRNTFYTYYGDKDELLQDMLQDLESQRKQRFEQLQAKDTEHTRRSLYFHIAESYIDVYVAHFRKIRNTEYIDELLPYYFTFINHCVSHIFDKQCELHPSFESPQIAAFLSFGTHAFLSASVKLGMDDDAITKSCHELIDKLLDSGIIAV